MKITAKTGQTHVSPRIKHCNNQSLSLNTPKRTKSTNIIISDDRNTPLTPVAAANRHHHLMKFNRMGSKRRIQYQRDQREWNDEFSIGKLRKLVATVTQYLPIVQNPRLTCFHIILCLFSNSLQRKSILTCQDDLTIAFSTHDISMVLQPQSRNLVNS